MVEALLPQLGPSLMASPLLPPTLMANWLEDQLGLSGDAQQKLMATALTVLALWLVRFGVLRLVRRTSESLTRQYYWRRISLNVMVVLGLLLVGRIWFSSFESLATIVGLASAGLAIALKDPITDLAGWIFLTWRKPFVLGHRIEIADFRGDVVDMRALQFSLMEVGKRVGGDARTGRVIHVPNGMVFRHPIANTSDGWFPDVFLEVAIVVTFESDWRKAREILRAIADKRGKERAAAMRESVSKGTPSYLIMREELDPEVLVHVVDHGVQLVVRLLTEPGQMRRTESRMWEDILDAFDREATVDYAYPTTRFYDNAREGSIALAPQRAERPTTPKAPKP